MKKLNKLFLAVIVSSAFFASCSSDDDNTPAVARGNYDGGLFIVNEGNNGTTNGTISFLSSDLKIENNVFTLVNSDKISGDTPQSIGINGDFAYIITNGSNKIELVNRFTFKSIATITTGLNNPRFIAFANGKGYVTNWGEPGSPTDDYVAVLDLTTNTVTSKIPVAEGPEKIIQNDAKLYVAHKGGWNQGNSLTIISAVTNTVTSNFTVGDVPSSLVKDNGTLYILCDGKPFYADVETAGKIVKLNLSTNTITSTINFPEKTHPGFLDIENSKLYYTIGTDVYSTAVSATTLPAASIFKASKVTNLYGFAVKNNQIYLADAVNYSDDGDIYIYSLTGTLSNTFGVGITPNGFYFNN
jgi:YVTN family beta-propeller protein